MQTGSKSAPQYFKRSPVSERSPLVRWVGSELQSVKYLPVCSYMLQVAGRCSVCIACGKHLGKHLGFWWSQHIAWLARSRSTRPEQTVCGAKFEIALCLALPDMRYSAPLYKVCGHVLIIVRIAAPLGTGSGDPMGAQSTLVAASHQIGAGLSAAFLPLLDGSLRARQILRHPP